MPVPECEEVVGLRDGSWVLRRSVKGRLLRRVKSNLRRGRRDARSGGVSKHGDGSRLGLWFHAACRGEAAERGVGSGCSEPLDHLHRSTADGADPGSKSAERARSQRMVRGLILVQSPVTENRVAAMERAGGWPESRSCECEQSRGEAGGAGSVVGTPQRKASSGAFCFCEPNPSSET